jgi:hypothetical protein
MNKDWLQGVGDAIRIVKDRQNYYESYRKGKCDRMETHPATFATLDEVLIFLEAMRERGQYQNPCNTFDNVYMPEPRQAGEVVDLGGLHKVADLLAKASIPIKVHPRSCKCDGEGWLWWNELKEYSGPAANGYGSDDTKYSCDADEEDWEDAE